MNADQESTDSSEKQETGNRGMPGLAFDFYVTNFTQLFLLVLQVFFLGYLAEKIFESDLILSLIYGALVAPLSVAVHRAIVLQEPLDASQYLASFRHGRVWRFIGYGVLIAVLIFLIVMPFYLIAGAGLAQVRVCLAGDCHRSIPIPGRLRKTNARNDLESFGRVNCGRFTAYRVRGFS
jgi:hypothetical protein